MTIEVFLTGLFEMFTLWLFIMLAIVAFMVSVRIIEWLAKKIM